MKIVCLVKQVPRADAIEFNPETKSLKREGVPLLLNPFDRFAVQHAVGLRAAAGGEVVVMTMGPPQAEEALRECLELGADRAIHLSDRVFAVADTIGTSRTLALALEQEGFDLVVCGRKTVDSETWQVPPETAAFLGVPHVTSVLALQDTRRGLRAVRETDAGYETYELPLPAVVSVAAAPPDDVQAEPGTGGIDVRTATDLVDDLAEHDKRFGQTGSPTRVLAVRDVTPERAGRVVADAREAAEAVATLLDGAESPGPTAWEKPERLGEQPGESYDCWSVVELVEGRAARVSLELLAKGRELSGKLGGENVALVLAADASAAAAEAVRHGAERVVTVEDERLRDYHPETFAAALRAVVERERPHVLLIPSTANGRDYGPRVAGELGLGMTGDCVNLGIDRAGRLIQTKPAYGGNIVSIIMGATTPQLATVRARMFDLLEPRDDAEARVERLAAGGLPRPTLRLVERREEERTAAYRIDEADVVVCAGAGLADDPDAVAELERVAAETGAAVGGEQAVCDAGLLSRNRQIGLFGRPVAPRVYVAVDAVDGFEHLTGFVKARAVVALGTAIPADVVVPGDWRESLPALLAALG